MDAASSNFVMYEKENHRRRMLDMRSEGLICLFLVLVTVAVFFQVRHHEFLNWDDPLYITENQHVKTGFTLPNIAWAFTTQHVGNWHPITWLSHMLDVHLYGMNPGQHHLSNLLFHIVNTLLLFLVFNRWTGKLWQSGFVAALFAIHPLHVESVAWISERKDVLSTFFGLLVLLAYGAYTRRPCVHRYLMVVICFVLGLMAKPMLVTWPLLLLLLDYWPLNRYQELNSGTSAIGIRYSYVKLIYEKIPLVVFSLISCVITFIAQRRGGAVGSLEVFPLVGRITNAIVSYVDYIGKMFWPFDLAFFYPHPAVIPWWKTAVSGAVMVSISYLALAGYRRYPWFFVGWLWYVTTLIPVIGLVQVGLQGMADRYTYIPLIGLFIIIAWFVPVKLSKWRHHKVLLPILAATVLTLLSIVSWRQVGYWKNNIMLNQHAVKVTNGNYLAHNNMGLFFADQKKTEKAIYHYKQALKFSPEFVFAHNNLGAVFAHIGLLSEAIEQYNKALAINPQFEGAHNNLALVLVKQGKIEAAIQHYKKALSIKPNFIEAHNNFGVLLAEQGMDEEAAKHFEAALRINPYCAGAHNNLGKLYESQDKPAQAIRQYLAAIRLEPDFIEARNNLGVVFAKQGRLKEAEKVFEEALKIDSKSSEVRYNLQSTKERLKKLDESISNLNEKIERTPVDSNLYQKLGSLYKSKGDLDKAVLHYRKALSIEPKLNDALIQLGVTYAMKGEYERGLSFLKRSIAYYPDHAEAYFFVASIYARQKKNEQSIHWLRQAIRKGYDNWERIKTDSNLENIRHTSEFKLLIKNH
jgi:tetratricopeptide (TPR) repeat protein